MAQALLLTLTAMLFCISSHAQIQAKVKDGPVTTFYEDGKKKFEANFKNQKADGEWKEWSRSGQIVEKGQMFEGEQDGDWHYWYPMGGYRSCKRFDARKKLRRFDAKAFTVAPVGVFQPAGGRVFSILAAWSPSYRLSKKFHLMGSFGAFPLRSAVTQKTFAGFEYQVLASYNPFRRNLFSFELGGGAQTWMYRGTTLLVSIGASLQFESHDCSDGLWTRRLERLYFMTSGLLIPGAKTAEVRVGARFRL